MATTSDCKMDISPKNKILEKFCKKNSERTIQDRTCLCWTFLMISPILSIKNILSFAMTICQWKPVLEKVELQPPGAPGP